MNKSKIEWCDSTWNPVTGCLHGCEYCYARRIAERFAGKAYKQNKDIFAKDFKSTLGTPDIDKNGHIIPYPHGFLPTFHKYRLDEPARKTKPQNIFVCSMADLFGEWVPDEWIQEVFKACATAPQHTYIFLTKNPKRYSDFSRSIRFNWCIGTTITCMEDIDKIHALTEPYTLGEKFLSIEPLLSDTKLTKDDLNQGILHKWIDWVIVGAQTGPGAIPPKPEWVQSIIDQCRAAGVPVFLKNNLNWPESIQEWPEGLR